MGKCPNHLVRYKATLLLRQSSGGRAPGYPTVDGATLFTDSTQRRETYASCRQAFIKYTCMWANNFRSTASCSWYTYCTKKTVANGFVSFSRQNKATLSRLERVHGTLECLKHRALSKTFLHHSTAFVKEYVSWCAAATVHAIFCPSRGCYVTWVPSYCHTVAITPSVVFEISLALVQ